MRIIDRGMRKACIYWGMSILEMTSSSKSSWVEAVISEREERI